MDDLLRIMAKVAERDFSERPALVEGDDEWARFLIGFRFMVEDLERSIRDEAAERVQLQAANDALKFQKAMLESQSEATIDGVLVVSPKGEILSFNRRFKEMWGIPDEVIASRSDDAALQSVLFKLVDPAEFLAKVKYLYDHPEHESRDEIRLKDGRTFDRYTVALRSSDGLHHGRVWYFRDATEGKRAEKELRDANERLKELDQMKTRLLNTAAHELNTPLTPILLQLHVLRKSVPDPKFLKNVDILDRNARRLAALVQDMLDVNRLQAGRLELRRESADLSAITREAFESFVTLGEKRGVATSFTTDGELWVEADPKRITQVLFNLLSNAFKFTPPGCRVDVSCGRNGLEALVQVRDSGVGLTPDELGKLYQPFTQIRPFGDGTESGTGLGLFISRGIVERHGGRIWTESAGVGKGATFHFTLPLVAQSDRISRRLKTLEPATPRVSSEERQESGRTPASAARRLDAHPARLE